jgi:branched-subunit amino acid transport protein
MNRDPIEPGPNSAGLPGVLRLTAGLAVVALAILAALVVLEVLPREHLASYGTRILLLALIVALASIGIAGLVRWGRRG